MRSALGLLSLLLVVACTKGGGGTSGGPAQKLPVSSPVRNLVGSAVAEEPDNTRAVALADLDADGDNDLVVGNDGEDRIFLNDGKGKFSAAAVLQSGATGALAIGDLDGDEAPEIVVGYSSGRPARVFLNRGAGKFEDAGFQGPGHVRALALFDADGDGDLDVVMGCGSGAPRKNFLFENDGKGNLTDICAEHLPPDRDDTIALGYADVDGDGDVDLLVANGAGVDTEDRLYLNDGAATFRAPGALPARAQGSSAVAFGDLNGDGKLDVVVGGPGANSIWIGDGRGGFRDESVFRLPADAALTTAVRVLDVDSDRDLDLLVVNDRAPSRIYLNDGVGRFGQSREGGLRTDLDRARDLAIGDVDGDGDPDLVIGNDGAGNSLYLNEGRVSFADASRAPALGRGDVAIGFLDVDGDRDMDFVAPNEARLLVNDGRGKFQAQPLPSGEWRVAQAASADVDSDGDLDVVLATTGRTRLLVNERGRFHDETARKLPDDSRDVTQAVLLVDVDADAKVDLFVANDGQNRLYLGTGRGQFEDHTAKLLPAQRRDSRVAVAGDIDGDGDPDLVVGEGESSNAVMVYRNDGKGSFEIREALPVAEVAGLVLGDIDGDSDPDLVVSLRPTTRVAGRTVVFANDGGGAFQRLPFTSRDGDPESPVLGDVDGDGDVDIVVAGRPTEVYLGNGSGVFVDATRVFFNDGLESDTVRLVDLDDDQDLDFVAVLGQKIAIRYGLKCHIFAKEAPRIGKPYEVGIWARAGYAPNGQVVIPYLAPPPSPALRIMPLGTWHLGLAGFVPFDAISVPAPVGETSLVMPIPLMSELVGVSFSMQVLVVGGPKFEDWRLTNSIEDTVLR